MASRTIVLHGRLGKAFGRSFVFEVATAAEALRALNANFPGRFLAELRKGAYQVIRGDRKSGISLDEGLIVDLNLGNADLHIIPVAKGSAGGGRSKGGIKIVLGVALVGIALVASGGLAGGGLAALGTQAFSIAGVNISWGTIALFGVGLALTGASSMMTKKEKPKEETKRDDSYSFSGPSNTNESGSPIPLIYGEAMAGGQPISSGIDIENIGAFAPGSGSGVPGGGLQRIDGATVPVQSELSRTIGEAGSGG
jgi:predicted phage tail protein